MTYDNDEKVLQLAHRHGFDTQTVSMMNTHHTEMTELLIGRDLEWARRGESGNVPVLSGAHQLPLALS